MRLIVSLTLIFISLFTNAAEIRHAKPESVGMSSDRLKRIAPFMQKYVDQKQLAGIVTLIAREGKIVHFEKVGKLNLVDDTPIKKDSLFRIYSMTKPIVSVAALMLYEEGKFQLTDPVEKYLPEFKNAKVMVDGKLEEQSHPFTVRELMSHTAGLTYGIFGRTEVDKLYQEALFSKTAPKFKHDTLAEMVENLGTLPLLYQPGEKWVYSLSADVLGRLIEVVSGMPLDRYLQTKLFAPLGMKDTFFSVPESKLARLGTNHARNGEGVLVVTETPEKSSFAGNVTFFSGGGGLVSTAMDYLKFSQMLLNDGKFNGEQILGKKTIELMTTDQLGEKAAAGFGEQPGLAGTIGFGLGVAVVTDQPKTILGSKGEYTWGGAAGTIFWIDPVENLVAILMVQMMRNPYDLRSEFKVLTDQAIIK